MVTIDPCAATPGHDYTVGLIFLAFYPLLAGGLLFFCLKNSRITKKANYWMACFVPVVNLVISFVSVISLLCKCEPFIRQTDVWQLMYKYDSCNDIDLKTTTIGAGMALVYYLLLILLWKFVKWIKYLVRENA
jgi:hypothetical protein